MTQVIIVLKYVSALHAVDCHLILSVGGCALGLGFGYLISGVILSLASCCLVGILCAKYMKCAQCDGSSGVKGDRGKYMWVVYDVYNLHVHV